MPRSPQKLAFLVAALLTLPPHGFAEASPASAVQQIRVRGEATGTVVEIWADGTVDALHQFSMADPPRVVVDFPGLRSALTSHSISVANAQVERIRVGRHADKVRVVVEVAPGFLESARLARSDRGVALVFGDAEIPELADRGPAPAPAPARRSATKRAAPDELSRAAQDLAAAARELSAAARELRASRSSALAAPVGAISPLRPHAPGASRVELPSPAGATAAPSAPRSTEVAARELRAARGDTGELERATPTPSAAAPRAASRPPVVAAVTPAVATRGVANPAVAPRFDSAYELTYAGVMHWLEEHRDTAPAFVPGEVVLRAGLRKLRPFLAPGYYEEFDFAGSRLVIQAPASHAAHDSYRRATLQYQGQTSIAPDGSVENYIAGQPFADERIAAASPRDGGLMVGWNNIFRWQHYGYRAGPIRLAYLAPGDDVPTEHADVLAGRGRVERVLVNEYQRVYLSHQAALEDQDYTVKVADAESQHYKDWMQFTEPFDMRGTAFVIERYRDPHEPDQVNSYLPTERKIRRISSKERSDRFLGSEMTLDDFEGFSGRVLDYEWEYRGEKSVLHVVDSMHPHSVFFGPMSHVPNDHWQLRRCHVVETRPLLPGHPHARKLTFYDAETYNIPFTLVFDSDDQLLKVIYTIYKWPGGSPAGDPGDTVSHYRSSVVINKQSKRSMVNWSEHTEIPDMDASAVRRLFNVSTLTGGR